MRSSALHYSNGLAVLILKVLQFFLFCFVLFYEIKKDCVLNFRFAWEPLETVKKFC